MVYSFLKGFFTKKISPEKIQNLFKSLIAWTQEIFSLMVNFIPYFLLQSAWFVQCTRISCKCRYAIVWS